MKKLSSAVLLLALAISAWAVPIRLVAIRPDLGVIYAPNLDPENETLPALLTYVLGCGFVMPLSEGSPWSFEPSADLYTNYYEWENDRAVPTEVADRDAFAVGLLIDAPIVFSRHFGEGNKWSASVGAGPAFDLRVGIKDSEAETGIGSSINGYFWGSGRFFQPTTFLRGEYMLTERVGFGFSVRFYWPVYNLWSGEGLSFWDQCMVCGSLGIYYRL
jgi:hypothetical protein